MTNLDKRLRLISLDAPEECEVMHSLSKSDIAQIKAAIAELVEGCLPKRLTFGKDSEECGCQNCRPFNDAINEIRNNLIKAGVLK